MAGSSWTWFHIMPVPDGYDRQMKTIARLSGGQSYTATNLSELNKDYDSIQNEIGYRTVPGPGSAGWLRLGVITAVIAAALALLINRRLPI